MLSPTKLSPCSSQRKISPLLAQHLQRIAHPSKAPVDHTLDGNANNRLSRSLPSGAGATYQKPSVLLGVHPRGDGRRPPSRDSKDVDSWHRKRVAPALPASPLRTVSLTANMLDSMASPASPVRSPYLSSNISDGIISGAILTATSPLAQGIHETHANTQSRAHESTARPREEGTHSQATEPVQPARPTPIPEFREPWHALRHGNKSTRRPVMTMHEGTMHNGATSSQVHISDDVGILAGGIKGSPLQKVASAPALGSRPRQTSDLQTPPPISPLHSPPPPPAEQARPARQQSPSSQRRMPYKEQMKNTKNMQMTRDTTSGHGSGSGKVGICFSAKEVEGKKRSGCIFCSKQCVCNPYESGEPSEGLKRSLQLMDTLYDIRRAVNTGNEANAEAKKSDIDDSVLKQILANTEDSYDSIQKIVEELDGGNINAEELGGSRHPTVISSNRALEVAKHKVKLLQVADERFKAFRAADRDRQKILIEIAYQEGTAPEALLNVRDVVETSVHSPANPADDVLLVSNFEWFSRNFKLPAKHFYIKTLEKESEEAGLWWAEEIIKLASRGEDQNSRKARLKAMNGEAVDDGLIMSHTQLKSLAKIVLTSCADLNDSRVKEMISLINDRMAEALYKHAKDLLEADKEMERSHSVVPVGPATQKAKEIEALVFECLKDGCPETNPKIEMAKKIFKDLYQVDSERKRLEARAKRKAGA